MSRAQGSLAGAAALLLACGTAGQSARTGPRLAARWTGTDTASFAAAASAERCDTLGLTLIRAISGDTGVGLALYDSGAPQGGTLPIRRPKPAEGKAPAAALALRWFSRTAVQGFQGDSGEVVLRVAGNGDLSGTFRAQASAVNTAARLELTGSFDAVPVRPAARGCEPPEIDSATTRPDSAAGVD